MCNKKKSNFFPLNIVRWDIRLKAANSTLWCRLNHWGRFLRFREILAGGAEAHDSRTEDPRLHTKPSEPIYHFKRLSCGTSDRYYFVGPVSIYASILVYQSIASPFPRHQCHQIRPSVLPLKYILQHIQNIGPPRGKASPKKKLHALRFILGLGKLDFLETRLGQMCIGNFGRYCDE